MTVRAAKLVNRRRFLGTLAAGSTLLAGCSFKTSRPPAAGTRPLRLVFFTDCHARVEWGTAIAMRKAAVAINAQKPELILGGGDFITDGFEYSAEMVAPRWDVFMGFYRALEAPRHMAIGNHDLVAAIPKDGSEPSPDPKAIYRDKLGLERTYYSFDLAGYHFMMLDSVQVIGGKYKYRGFIDEEQQDWIRADLSGIDPGTPIVVCLHIPLLTVYYQAVKGATFKARPNRVVVNNLEVLKLFERHNLILVLQGHLHAKERLQWRDTAFITGGAICGRWWRGPWQGTPEGFNVVTLRPDRIDWEYIAYGWQARRPDNQ